MLDQLEERLLAPVDVLEDEHERLRLRELLGPRAGRPRDLLLAALALHGLEHADGEAEQVSNRLVLAARPELLLCRVERIVVRDAGRRLHHLGKRPVRDALAVGEAAAHQHGGALDAGDELARKPALPHAGVAVEGEQRGAAVAHGAREGVLEQLELALAAHERRGEAADRRARVRGAHDAVRGDRLRPAPQLERADLLQRRKARAHGALCVVLVRQRHAERGHHRVAGELLDDPAVRDDAMGDLLEELRDAAADDLRIRTCEELRRGDEIDEQDGRKLPLHRRIVVARVSATEAVTRRFP